MDKKFEWKKGLKDERMLVKTFWGETFFKWNTWKH